MENNKMNDKLLTAEQLAERFEIDITHVYKLVKEGAPFFDIGTSKKPVYRFNYEEVLRWAKKWTEFKKGE